MTQKHYSLTQTITSVYPGRTGGVSNTRATSQYPRVAAGFGDRFHDDWEREREKHQKTLNGTRYTSIRMSRQEPAAENWPCVDNTSCEIQLSLVEQQQKLLSRKRQSLAKSPTSSHASLQNGHSDTSVHPVLSSIDNKPADENRASANRSIHSESQREFLHDADLYRDVASRGGWSRSVDNFRTDLDRSIRALTNVPAYKSPVDVPAATAGMDKKHVGERDFDVGEEQMRKKQKRLHHLRGSQKSGKLHRSYFMLNTDE